MATTADMDMELQSQPHRQGPTAGRQHHCRSGAIAKAARADPAAQLAMVVQPQSDRPGYNTCTHRHFRATYAGTVVPRHTHPGIESSYVFEGGFELPIQGQPTRMLKPGDGFQIPPETPHAGGKPGYKKTRVAITYVVEKGKPLVSPA